MGEILRTNGGRNMLSIPILLIPFFILCIGLIINFIYDSIRWKYNKWEDELESEIKKRIESSLKLDIREEVKSQLEKKLSKPETFSQKERFQKLAGIEPDQNYEMRFNLQNMTDG